MVAISMAALFDANSPLKSGLLVVFIFFSNATQEIARHRIGYHSHFHATDDLALPRSHA